MDSNVKKAAQRSSGIELLRVLMACGIIVMHFNNVTVGGGFRFVESGSINYIVLCFFQSLALPSVNVFIIIMGYFMVNKKNVPYGKALKLFIEGVIFHVLSYVLSLLLLDITYSPHDFIVAFFPTYYFIILYLVIYILSPYINMTLKQLNKKEYEKLLITLIILFSLYPMVIDIAGSLLTVNWTGLSTVGMYGHQNGYTIVQFIMMYCIGGYLRLHQPEKKHKKQRKGNFVIYGGTTVIVFLVLIFVRKDAATANQFHYFYDLYSIIIILQGICLFQIFCSIHFVNVVINQLAKAALSVYMIQNVFLRYILTENIVHKNTLAMICNLFCIVAIIYLIGFLFGRLYNILVQIIEKSIIKYRR